MTAGPQYLATFDAILGGKFGVCVHPGERADRVSVAKVIYPPRLVLQDSSTLSLRRTCIISDGWLHDLLVTKCNG